MFLFNSGTAWGKWLAVEKYFKASVQRMKLFLHWEDHALYQNHSLHCQSSMIPPKNITYCVWLMIKMHLYAASCKGNVILERVIYRLIQPFFSAHSHHMSFQFRSIRFGFESQAGMNSDHFLQWSGSCNQAGWVWPINAHRHTEVESKAHLGLAQCTGLQMMFWCTLWGERINECWDFAWQQVKK